MNILLSLFLIFNIVSVNAAKTTNLRIQTATKIYEKLIAPLNRRVPPLKIIHDPQLNAFNDGRNVILTDTLLNEITDKEELAAVIAHEIAHNFIQRNKDLESTVMIEDAADRLGTYILLKAGFDTCKGRNWVKHMYQKKGGDYMGVDMDHPLSIIRYDAFTMPWCK